jgi:hypothetical protein
MFKKILAFINNAHLLIGGGVFAAGTFVAMHGMMSGPFVGFTSTVFGFLAGHHYIENAIKDQNPPDKDNQ